MGLLNTQNETTEEQRIRQTKRSSIDVPILLSPVSHLARYSTQPELKFDAFIRLKRGEEKLIRNFVFRFSSRREQH